MSGLYALFIAPAHAITCGASGFTDIGGGVCRGFFSTTSLAVLTTTNWTVPSDWNSSNNTIEGIGIGGAGAAGFSGGAGGTGNAGGGGGSKGTGTVPSLGAGSLLVITYTPAVAGGSTNGRRIKVFGGSKIKFISGRMRIQ